MKTSTIIKLRIIRNRIHLLIWLTPFVVASVFGAVTYGYFLACDFHWLWLLACLACAAFATMFIRMLISEIKDERHAKIVPYFSKRINSKIETFGSGTSIAGHIDLLDSHLLRLGLRTLSSYGYADSVAKDDGKWHDPAEVCKSIEALLQITDLPTEVRQELEKIHAAATHASNAGATMRLHIRGSDRSISLYEMDIRKGSYF